jgi:Inward rectifier potassium channel transmembrane domain
MSQSQARAAVPESDANDAADASSFVFKSVLPRRAGPMRHRILGGKYTKGKRPWQVWKRTPEGNATAEPLLGAGTTNTTSSLGHIDDFQFPHDMSGHRHANSGVSPGIRSGSRSHVSTRRVGGRMRRLRLDWNDPFHSIINWPWWRVILFVSAIYLGVWFLFGLAYYVCINDGCLEGDNKILLDGAQHTVWTAFFFSVETMTTIGFGDMYPTTSYANVIFTLESLVGVFVDAATIGLVYAKFARATARAASIVFSSNCIIGTRNGKPCVSPLLPSPLPRRRSPPQPTVSHADPRISLSFPGFYFNW